MRKALRRASWAWTVAAGTVATGVSVVSVAVAQRIPPVQTPSRQQEASRSANRPLEIAIELAWLGDPVTFPCQLAAHLSDAGAEVRGYVPNKAARDRALQLARLNCPLPVVDQL